MGFPRSFPDLQTRLPAMRVVIGIGNPGRQYADSRHNLGWLVVDQLAARHHLAWRGERRWQAEVADWPGSPAGRALLVKPQTFVNRSGETAQALCAFHHIPPTDLLVVVDDLTLATGHLRLRDGGSAGGHNGLKDIESRLGQGYPRLRLGCGPLPADADQVGFVLTGFPPGERADAQAMVGKAADAVEAWLREGVAVACRYNGPLHPPPRPVRPPRAAPAPSATVPPPDQPAAPGPGPGPGSAG